MEWLKATEICVVVSPEQGEVDEFRKWGLEIEPHRKKMVDRKLELEFKKPENPFRVVIVCAMWLDGDPDPILVAGWLANHRVRVLNVAGSCDSKHPGLVHERATEFMGGEIGWRASRVGGAPLSALPASSGGRRQ